MEGVIIVEQKGPVHACGEVSVEEASSALETLSNLLFLTAQRADDGSQVRNYMSDSGRCLSILTAFVKFRCDHSAKGPSPSSYEQQSLVHH
jgi:hypothetical protein